MTAPEYPNLLPLDENAGGHAACGLPWNGLLAALSDPYSRHLNIVVTGEENTTENSTEFVYEIQGRRFRMTVQRDDL